MAEMDIVFRSENQNSIVYELKKLTETQMKEIIALQREIDIRHGCSPVKE